MLVCTATRFYKLCEEKVKVSRKSYWDLHSKNVNWKKQKTKNKKVHANKVIEIHDSEKHSKIHFSATLDLFPHEGALRTQHELLDTATFSSY